MPTAAEFIKAKEIQIRQEDGADKTFVISRLPATVGREIATQYPATSIPKVHAYTDNEALMFKLMAYTAVVTSAGEPLALSSRALIDNHCESWEVLMRLEKEMLTYNASFFRDGGGLNLYEKFLGTALQFLSPMLTRLLGQLSGKVKQP